jgi:hypothetical protein
VSEESNAPPQRVSRRNGLIWFLVAFCFAPAIAIRLVPGGWLELHPVAKWLTIGIGAFCTLAVAYLIITDRGDGGARSHAVPPPPSPTAGSR